MFWQLLPYFYSIVAKTQNYKLQLKTCDYYPALLFWDLGTYLSTPVKTFCVSRKKNKENYFRFPCHELFLFHIRLSSKIIILASGGNVFSLFSFRGNFEFFLSFLAPFLSLGHPHWLRIRSNWLCLFFTTARWMTSRVGATLVPSQTPLPVPLGRRWLAPQLGCRLCLGCVAVSAPVQSVGVCATADWLSQSACQSPSHLFQVV